MNDPLILSLSTLPSVPFTDMLQLPEKPAVYFALDSTGKPLYIGATRGLRSRWQGHHVKHRLQELGCTTIAWLSYDGEELQELQQLEATMIEYFVPICNHVWRRRIPSPHKERVRVCIDIDKKTWLTFRIACLEQKLPFANREIERLMRDQLAAWQQQPLKETDHA